MMRFGRILGLLAATTTLCAVALAADNAAPRSLEADWLRQAAVRGQPAGNITTAEDAPGGCDGIKDGKWGFHTNPDSRPAWWQVDLGQVQPISRVVVYNRCDAADRARHIEILLSDDGQAFKSAYRHDGAVFYGTTDRKPLVVPLNNAAARFVRLQVPPNTYFHLDEVEVYGSDPAKNLALHRPADQSSTSQWSTRKSRGGTDHYPIAQTLQRGRKLAADLNRTGVNVAAALRGLEEVEAKARSVEAGSAEAQALYLRARSIIRGLALANPLLDFDRILFVKRAPGVYSHMSDQYYSWWARPGGGVFILSNFKSDAPALRCLTNSFPEGSFLAPDLSHDGQKVIFSYCRHYNGRIDLRDKVNKDAQPEDAFYHIFEMNLDGTGLRQLTRGRYDDTFPRYLPDGQIVFLSTRRGTFLQCGKQSAMATLEKTLPDSYVRCGGDAYRPVAIYTLHTMDRDGGNLRAISAFESFEWDPIVADDGRILYARWDYVDRHNGPFMKVWSTNPDGTNPRIVYGNFTRNPQSTFEFRSVPNSSKLLLTASAHHSITGGSLALLDTASAIDGTDCLTRLTPEVCFPETEGWPSTYYTNPYPLSERYYLTAWSDQPLLREGSRNSANHLGIYLYDAFGNLELIYRDPAISSMYPLPVRPRPTPPAIASTVNWDGPQEGRFLLQNVYDGLTGVEPGTIKRLRIVAMPVKVQPNMNQPVLGVTAEDPGKLVLGTVPVESDGSAYFRAPSGVSVFFQALDEHGRAVQTMRSLTYVQPGQTLSCIGCHESRAAAPPSTSHPLAALRQPSRLTPGPEGTWPMRYDRLVQPVLEKHCVSCHRPDAADQTAARFDLTAGKSYDRLVSYGKPSLVDHIRQRWNEARSLANGGASHTSALLAYLQRDPTHRAIPLTAADRERIYAWMDTYAQRQGHFSNEQEQALELLRHQLADMLDQ